MPTLWAQTAEYDNISVGDDLPILVKFEFRPPLGCHLRFTPRLIEFDD